MKILINDFENTKEEYIRLYDQFGYEQNEIIFCNAFQDTKTFLEIHLEKRKSHLDLIITNDSSDHIDDVLKADELSIFKNNMLTSFSKSNFRINSIPIILYTDKDIGIIKYNTRYDAIVHKNTQGKHDYFINKCEECIRIWRKSIFNDLDNLGLKIYDLINFQNSNYFKNYYHKHISNNAQNYFANKTTTLSLEYISLPTPLSYDWIILDTAHIEEILSKYVDTYKHHIKYDRLNNERTILHKFFNDYKLVLLRDVYSDLKYEQNLYDINAKTSEECDFILRTEYPDFLNTTFFEIKKEDVTFYVKKDTKRPQISSNFLSHLEQIWRYKEYSENSLNKPELIEKLDYDTSNYNYVLLAGRLEEKEEVLEKFESDIDRMYKGVNVITYEELEKINTNYLDKFNRLQI